MADDVSSSSSAIEESCAQCGNHITPDDRVAAGDRVFCRTCYASLRRELESAVQTMSEDIPYANATLGAVLGGGVGVLVWWGFTVATGWGIGLLAIGIGWAVGWGTVRFAGNKRSRELQFLAAGVAIISWVAAQYLVNTTFINRQLAKDGNSGRLPFLPESPEMFWMVFTAGFGVMDVVFLAIMVWEAWKMPRPILFPPPPREA